MWVPKARNKALLVCALVVAILVWQMAAPLTATSRALNAASASSASTTYSPSYLLLSNFANETALVVTGVPVLKGDMEGLPPQPLTLENIFVNGRQVPVNVVLYEGYSNESQLNINNTITVEGDWGSGLVALPPYTNDLLLLLSAARELYVNLSFEQQIPYVVLRPGVIIVNSTPKTFICTNMTKTASSLPGGLTLASSEGSVTYLVIATSNCSGLDVSKLLEINDERVSAWLGRSKPVPPTISENEAAVYYLSLLLLKDDQNPYNGLFAASPSPVYLYSWVRDSSFAAMALQASGHVSSAAKYWLWLATNASWMLPGSWYTRYNFYTGEPDKSFGIPEYDGEALFEIGVFQFYEVTRNSSFLYAILPALTKVVEFQVRAINASSFHMVPEDLSVWEDRLAYHFWTEALTVIGLHDASELLNITGNATLASEALKASELLNESVQRYFWNGSAYCSALIPVVVYTNEGATEALKALPPCVDSSTLLPIALYPEYWGVEGATDVNTTLRALWNYRVGGLPRFYDDTYHYTSYLYDSSGPSPPWIITTLFLALYYAQQHNYSGDLDLLEWASQHSQHGLLPEAVDPNYGYPLPSTSPLTWSAAMYVIVITSMRASASSGRSQVIVAVVILIAVIVVVYVLRRRFNVLTGQ